MAETVDTRVVEARFDSKQFEQGVDKTVKKLDELKSSLNLKNGEKSIAEIGNKISETSEKANKSLEKLQDRFTSFAGMLKQKLLSGIADEIVGVFFKIENGIKNMVHGLSSAQISVGMQRYTDILTSVRTLVSAGVDQGLAYQEIERLGEYADQTSYSLDELVSTMSKFKTAGADVDTARRMVEGLSNAAASMGVNAQQASRAYLNLQQAYSKGAMLQNDWISFESLPMVGEKFSEAILQAAVRVGTLKETVKGTYQTVKNIDSQVKTSGADAKGITAQNMGTKLSSRWFNKAVMEEVFGNTYYFDAIERSELNTIKSAESRLKEQVKAGRMSQEEMDNELQAELDKMAQKRLAEKTEQLDAELKAGKITAEKYKKILDNFNKTNVMTVFGYNAFRAGQEARSLNDVLLTLKDTISRGWAKSFELIFGKLDEAAEFFTALTESNFAEAIYAIGEIRNAILEIWATPGENGAKSGRDYIIESLKQIDDLLGSIFEKMGLIRKERTFFDQDEYEKILSSEGGAAAQKYKEEMRAAQEEFDNAAEPWRNFVTWVGEKLFTLSFNFSLFTKQVNDFFTVSLVNGETRLDRIGNVLEGVKTALVIVTDTASRLYKEVIKPLGESVLSNIEKAIQPIYELINPNIKDENGENVYSRVSDALTNILNVASELVPKITPIINILGDVLGFFIDLASGTIMSNITFFTDAIGLITELLLGTDKSAQGEKGASVIEGISKSIKDLGESCKNAFKFVFDFFESIIKDFRILIGLDEGEFKEGGVFANVSNFFENNEFINSVRDKINQALTTVGDFIKDIPNKIKTLPSLIGEFLKGIFYEKSARYNGSMLEETWVKKPITEWLETAVKDVWNFITVEIPKAVASVPSMVSELLRSLFYTKKQVARDQNGNIIRVWGEEGGKSPLKEWLDAAIASVKNFITVEIPNKIKTIPSLVGEFFKGIFYEKSARYNGSMLEETWVKKPITEWLETAVKDVWNFITVEIPNAVLKVPSLISEFFNSLFYTKKQVAKDQNGNIIRVWGKDGKTPLKEWLDTAIADVKLFIKQIPAKIKKIPSIIGEFFKKIFYYKTSVGNTGKVTWVKKPFTKWIDDNVVTALKDFIKNLPTYVGQAIGNVGNFISNIVGAIFGKPGDAAGASTEVTDELQKPFLNININNILETIKDIGRKIVNGVVSVFTGTDDWDKNRATLADMVAGWINGIRTKAEEIWPNVRDWIVDLPNKIKNLFEGNKTEAAGEDSPIGSAISEFIASVGGWISGIPDMLLTFWENAEKEVGSLWQTIIGWITGESAEKEIKGIIKPNSKRGMLNKLLEEDKAAGSNKPSNKVLENLGSFFDHLVEYIQRRITNLPTDIANGANNLVTILNGLMEKATGWFKDANENGAKGITDDEGVESPFLKAISELGATVSGFITGTLPGFISEGITYVKNHAEEWANAFVGLFNGGERTAQEEVNRFGDNIANFFKMAFKEETFDQKVFSQLMESGRVEDALNYEKTTKNPILEFFRGIIKKIGEIFSAIGPTILNAINTAFEWIGGKIQWATAFLNNRDKSEKITDSLAKELGGEGGEENSEFIKALQNIGGTLKDLILDIIPGFIQAGISEIATSLPSLFGGIFGGNESEDMAEKVGEEAKKEIEKQKNAVQKEVDSAIEGMEFVKVGPKNKKDIDSAKKEMESIFSAFWISSAGAEEAPGKTGDTNKQKKSIEDVFSGGMAMVEGFGNLAGKMGDLLVSDVGKKIALLLAIGYLMSTIRDTISISDTIHEVGTTALKVTIGAAVAGIVAILGYITYIAATGNDTQFERVKTILDKVQTIIEAIGGVVNVFMGFKTVGNIFGGAKQAAQTIKTVTKTMNGFGAVGLAAGVGAVSYGAETVVDSLMGMFAGASDDLRTIATFFSDAVEKLLSIKMTVDDAIEVAKKMVTLISEVQKIGDYVDSINTIETMMPKLTGALNLFTESMSGRFVKAKEVTDALERIINMKDKMTEFAQFVEKDNTFEDFKYALASLGSAMALYSGGGIDSTAAGNGDFATGVMTVLSQILGNENFEGLIQQLNGNFDNVDAKKVYASSEKIVLLAGAIASIGNASEGINQDTGNNIQELFTLVSSLELPTDNTEINGLASKFGTLGNALSTFANDTKEFTADGLKNAKDAITILRDLSQDLKGTGQGFLEKLFEGDEGIDEFGTKLSLFGEKLHNFFEKVNGTNSTFTYNDVNIKTALYAVRSIAASYRMLNEKELLFKTDFKNLGSGLEEFGPKVNTFLTALKNLGMTDNDIGSVRKLVDIVQVIAEVAANGVGNNANRELGELGNQLDILNENGFAKKAIGFFEAITKMTVNVDSVGIFAAFADVFTAIAEISSVVIKSEHGSYQKQFSFAMQHLTEIFQKFNENYGEMKSFFENVKDFDSDGIAIAMNLFAGLKNLASAMTLFSDETKIMAGFDNLTMFDWDPLYKIFKDNILDKFAADSEGISPKLTPVLELTDFEEQVTKMKNLLGFMVDPATGEWRTTIPLSIIPDISLPETHDYSQVLGEINGKLESISTSTSNFNTSMSRLKIEMDGRTVGYIVAPYVSEQQGAEMNTRIRGGMIYSTQ